MGQCDKNNKAKKLKLVFTLNADFAFLSHRLPYANAARDAGYDVVVVAPNSGCGHKIQALGFEYHSLSNARKRSGLIPLLTNLIELALVYRNLKPDIIHNSSIVMCALGTVASFVVPRAAVINGFTGLGFLFSDPLRGQSFTFRVVLWFLGFALRRPNIWPLFQNEDDYRDLAKVGLCRQRPNYIEGSGVDTGKFQPLDRVPNSEPFVIGCAARLLRDKGFDILLEAMRLVGMENQNIELRIVGSIDESNPSSYAHSEVKRWSQMKNVKVLGWQEDMVSFWQHCDVAILLSVREGLPKALIEACACGLPIIASNVPGCRMIVRHDENGLLVPYDDAQIAAEAIIRMEADISFRMRARAESRRHIFEGGFSERSIRDKYKQLLENISLSTN